MLGLFRRPLLRNACNTPFSHMKYMITGRFQCKSISSNSEFELNDDNKTLEL